MSVSARLIRAAIVASTAVLFAQIVGAACLDDATVAKLVAGYPTTPVSGIPTDLSLEDAYCTQAKYVALLHKSMGGPVGYKVGFTGKATQEQFGIPTPAYGVLFAPMFIADGGVIARNFGHRPLIEPDLEEFKPCGKTLKAGDRLSLGAVGKLFPLKEGGKTCTYTLNGLRR